MNILQVLPELNLGGVETGTIDLAKSLVELGHKAVVVSAGGELVDELKKTGAIHYSLNLHRKSPLSIFKNIRVLSDIIKKEKIDVVHARSRAPAWSAFFAARCTNTAFVTTCHGYYSVHPFSYVMGWGKFVIVPSQIIGRHQIEDFGVPFNRIRHIPRSVDIERFKFKGPQQKNQTELIVGIIGRITPIKGHTYFLRAMSKVARDISSIKFWIVGDVGRGKERYKDEIDVLIKRLGLSGNVEFLRKQRDIPHILNQLNLLVVSTIGEEAFGRVIIEAQAVGVPVVATRVGGIVDIIEDGKNGLLVPARDIQAMSEATIKLLRDANLAKNIVILGRKTVLEKFTLDKMVKSILDVYREVLVPNILVIKFSALGDVILTTPALIAIRNKYPNAKITCLTSKESEELLSRCPYIDNLVVSDFNGKDKGIFGLFRLAKMLRKISVDLSIDLQNNRRSHLLSFLSLAPHRYGYDNKKLSFLLNHRKAVPKDVLAPVEHQSKILGLLGIDSYDKKLELWPGQEDDKYIDDLLGREWITKEQRLVGINISSSGRWKTKRWPVKYIIKLADILMHDDIRLVLTGTEKDIVLARDILRISKAKPIIACGKTSLNQLACLIKRCYVYISGDSAPLHIAASVGVPFVALFGATDPLRHMPPADKTPPSKVSGGSIPVDKFILIRKELLCSPCYKTDCTDTRCMFQIAPEEVSSAVKSLL